MASRPIHMLVFVNNKFVEEDRATLKVSDLAIQRGYGIFDFCRTANDLPLFLDDHLDRFFHSAAMMRLQCMLGREEIIAAIYELIHQNALGESGIKLILTGGYSNEGFDLTDANLVIVQQRLVIALNDSINRAIHVITHEYQRDLPAVKSINYLMAVWLQQKVRDHHADDVLYCNNGCVSELPRANVFMVTADGKLVTPADNILHGVTRKKILDLALGKYKVELRPVKLEEMKEAAELFITSSSRRITPIARLDDIVMGNGAPGPVTMALHEDFIRMEKQALAYEAERSLG